MMDERLLVGKINGLFGVQGFVKVFSYTKPRENIFNYRYWYIKQDKDNFVSLTLKLGRKQGKKLVAQLHDVATPEAAQSLLGKDVYIDKSALAKNDKDEYYWYQLTGLNVLNQNGENLGTVSHLIDTGANDVLVIKNGAQETLIPFINQFVLEVSLADKMMRVYWQDDFS